MSRRPPGRAVDADGGLHVTSGRMAFLEGLVGVRRPASLSADARVHEGWGERTGCFRIVVPVQNRVVGPVVGHHGSLTVRMIDTTAGVPAAVRAYREEIRA